MDILGAMAVELEFRCLEMPPKFIVMTLNAFLELKYYPSDRTLQTVLDAVQARIGSLSGGETVKLAYLSAQFNVVEGSLGFFKQVEKHTLAKSLIVTPNESLVLAWAFALCDRLTPELFEWVINLVEELPESFQSDNVKVR